MRRLASTSLACIVSVLGLTTASSVSAHVALTEPPARYDSMVYIKDYPCGNPDDPPGDVTRTYEEGETIMVSFDEYVQHPGHFRISLSTEGDQALVDPMDYDDFYPADNVLMDDIEDPDGVTDLHTIEVQLPAGVTCEKCTLQLLQIMTDKPPWGDAGGNDIYYQCADISITPVGAGTGTGVDSTGGADSGGTGSSDGGGSTDGGTDPTDSASATAGLTTAGDSGNETTGTPDSGTGTSGVGSDDDSDSGCGCRSQGGPGIGTLGFGVLVLGAARRRRR